MEGGKFLDISWKSILKIAFAIACFYVLYSVKDVLVLFIFAITISLLFNPAIDFLQEKKIPRVLSVVLIYAVVFGILALSIFVSVPILMSEIGQFLDSFPQYFARISPPLKSLGFEAFNNIESFLSAAKGGLQSMSENIFSGVFAFFGGIFSAFFVIMTAFFISLEKKVVENSLILLFPKKYEAQAIAIWEKCQNKVSGWFAARLIACAFVGISSYIAFLLFGVKYSLALAIFAGISNFIPYIGPILSGFVLFFVIFPTEIFRAIFVIAAFALIQQIENNILSPVLMKRFIGLPPALVLFSIVIGGKLWGVLGAVLAIPLAGILFEFTKEFLQKRKEKKV
jgi:predicted PurR-regulated permease PerM